MTIVSEIPAFPAFISCRSHYAPSKAACTIPALIKRAQKLGWKALGLMDDDTIAGCLEFSEKAKKAGIKPINGVRLKVVIPLKIEEVTHQVAGVVGLIALNETGWSNIQWLVGKYHSEHREGFPLAEFANNPDYTDRFRHVACLSGSIQIDGESDREGLLPKIISQFGEQKANGKAIMLALSDLKKFFSGEFYIEITRPGMSLKTEDKLLKIAAVLDKNLVPFAPIIATPDVRYPGPDDHVAWRLIWAKYQGYRIRERALREAPEPVHARYVLSPEQMNEFYADLPEAISSVTKLAIRATFAPAPAKPMLPTLRDKVTGEDLDSDLAIREQSFAGLNRLFSGDPSPKYIERLEYEIGVIIRMGFPSYFLMVADFVNAAKAQGIQVGIGRGSGAGSLVAYCLGITGVDPLEYGLLFERFLNPDRVSMPDFDIDFDSSKRDKVFQYLRDTYGEDRCANIITYMAPKPRGAVTMVYQVVVPDSESDMGSQFRRADLLEVNRLIPVGQKDIDKPLDQLLVEYPALAAKAAKDPMVAMLFKYAMMVKDIYIQTGIHAAGIVLAPKPLSECMPVVWDVNSNHCVCAYAMKYAEMAGFVKFDILSLETLTVIDSATAWIRRRGNPEFDLQKVPIDDAKVYAAMAEGLSSGSFQFGSEIMKKGLRQIVPTRIHDLIALNALCRPGPMEHIPKYAECKAGLREPEYEAPGTEEILGETYGIMIYQEQIMQIAQKVAGYSLGAADLLRRAMGKKDKVEMDKHRHGFIYGDERANIPGCIKLGMSEVHAINLFNQIAKFADYGFNKSHAAVYAYLGYWTMWLKVHYPAEFMAAQITTKIIAGGKPEKRSQEIDQLINDSKASGLTIYPPSINKSVADFAPEGDFGLRPGFAMLKGVSSIKREFFEAREERQFSDLLDFFQRGKPWWNKTQLGKLIDVGALDELHPDVLAGKLGSANRRQILELLDWYGKEVGKKAKAKKANSATVKAAGQIGLDFGEPQPIEDPEVTIVPNYIPDEIREKPDQGDRSSREYAAAGLFISSHPIRVAILNELGFLGVKTFEGILDRRNRTRDAKPSWNICVLIASYQVLPEREDRTGTIRINFKSYSESGVAYFNIPNNFRHQRDGISVDRILAELEAAKNSMTPVVMVGRLSESGKNFNTTSLISASSFVRHAVKRNGWIRIFLDPTILNSTDDIESIAECMADKRASHNDPLRTSVIMTIPMSHIRPQLAVSVSMPGVYKSEEMLNLNSQGGIAAVNIYQSSHLKYKKPAEKLKAAVLEESPSISGESEELPAEIEEEEIYVVEPESESHEYGVEDAPNFSSISESVDEKETTNVEKISTTIHRMIAELPDRQEKELVEMSTEF